MKRRMALCAYLATIAAILVADLWSKAYVFDLLEVAIVEIDHTPRIVRAMTREVIPEWFEFEAVLNYGAFSGWFSGFPWLLVGVSAIAVVVTTALVTFPARTRGTFVIAFGLVAGGALGNLYDRVSIGAVRDFLKVFYVWPGGEQSVWPNFNIADSAICTGVGLILVVEFFGRREPPSPAPVPAAAESVAEGARA